MLNISSFRSGNNLAFSVSNALILSNIFLVSVLIISILVIFALLFNFTTDTQDILLQIFLRLIMQDSLESSSITRTMFKDVILTTDLKMVYPYEFGNLLTQQTNVKTH